MDIIKVGILGVAAVFLAIPLRKEKQEYSMFLSMAVCICIFIYILYDRILSQRFRSCWNLWRS